MIVSEALHAFIYAGRGGYCSSLPHVEALIKSHSDWTFSRVSEKEFAPSEWDPNRSVCVLLGGEASLIEEAIGDRAEDLREYFQSGGRGLLICGSSFASAHRRIYYEKSKEGILNLFQGSAIGPLFPEQEVRWQNRSVKIRWNQTGDEGYVMSIGGGYYVPDHPEEIEVLATYLDGRIAAFAQRYKLGIVIHSMIHFEEAGLSSEGDIASMIDEESLRFVEKRFPDIHHHGRQLSVPFINSCAQQIIHRLNDIRQK